MNESNDKRVKFFGAYFDRDSVVRLARWAEGVSWVVLTIYVLTWLASVLLTVSQMYNGMMGAKGGTFLMALNLFSPYLTQVLPGVFYFFGLQAISKSMLILLDMEDNTRRAARK
jgi:hypothetical protein